MHSPAYTNPRPRTLGKPSLAPVPMSSAGAAISIRKLPTSNAAVAASAPISLRVVPVVPQLRAASATSSRPPLTDRADLVGGTQPLVVGAQARQARGARRHPAQRRLSAGEARPPRRGRLNDRYPWRRRLMYRHRRRSRRQRLARSAEQRLELLRAERLVLDQPLGDPREPFVVALQDVPGDLLRLAHQALHFAVDGLGAVLAEA